MKIFVNNKPICISENPKLSENYSKFIDLHKEPFKVSGLSGKILIQNAKAKDIIEIIESAQNNKIAGISEITFLVKNKSEIQKKLKKSIAIVKAAGGIVENHQSKILMMKRLGYWDLPKGKADEGENSAATAQREVEEECNVQVIAKEKICTTWHTYYMKGKLVMKRTKWYRMVLITDKKMKPQKEEGIEELKWMTLQEVNESMAQSYLSIAHVVKKFEEKFSREHN